MRGKVQQEEEHQSQRGGDHADDEGDFAPAAEARPGRRVGDEGGVWHGVAFGCGLLLGLSEIEMFRFGS